jgi:hypothetical protein
MDFDTLNKTIPYVYSGKKHLLSYNPYPNIKLMMPGRHATDTDPIGGDFVVCVTDPNKKWKEHQFTHEHLFGDIEKRMEVTDDVMEAEHIMVAYACIVFGADPELFDFTNDYHPGVLNGQTFLQAVQCLAVAEHRRYYMHESKGGGKFLPARFASGIVEGLWTAFDAGSLASRGRPGLDRLIKEKGTPRPLKEWKTLV